VIKVLVLSETGGDRSVRYLARPKIVWVAEGGPGYCYVRLDDGIALKVAGPAADLVAAIVGKGEALREAV
jgi:hypothetical protein